LSEETIAGNSLSGFERKSERNGSVAEWLAC